MLKETVYTSIGAAALTVEFVIHPEKSQSWLKKAERRGSRIAAQYEKGLRSLTKEAESALGELRQNPLSVLGVERNGATASKPVKAVRRRASKVRRTAKARVSRVRRNGVTSLPANTVAAN